MPPLNPPPDAGDRPRHPSQTANGRDLDPRGPSTSTPVRVSIVTPGVLVALCLAVGLALTIPIREGPGRVGSEGSSSPCAEPPGFGEGNLGLRPGSVVRCLSHP